MIWLEDRTRAREKEGGKVPVMTEISLITKSVLMTWCDKMWITVTKGLNSFFFFGCRCWTWTHFRTEVRVVVRTIKSGSPLRSRAQIRTRKFWMFVVGDVFFKCTISLHTFLAYPVEMCDYNFVLTWLHAEFLVSWDQNLPHLFLLNSIRDSGTLIEPVLLTSRSTKDRSWHSCMLMPLGRSYSIYSSSEKAAFSTGASRNSRSSGLERSSSRSNCFW